MGDLATELADVLDEALGRTLDDRLRAELTTARSLLDTPLRIAIAGRMKSGKSTLLNAIVGEPIAPTDATECTKVVTVYREGLGYRAEATLRTGERRSLELERTATACEVDLGGISPADIEVIDVEWPSARLRGLALIDTPGLDSSTIAPPVFDADCVVYVMSHLHPEDHRFLDAFRDPALGGHVAVNAIGVLSRADQVEGGAPSALATAAAVAAETGDHPVVRRLCSQVVPVAGLLGLAAATVTETEFRVIAAAAGEPDIEDRLLSVDRFGDRPERADLLDRLGLFGVRLVVAELQSGRARTGGDIADILATASGVGALTDLLTARFRQRADLLHAHHTLRSLERMLPGHDHAEARRLHREFERIRAGAHELEELRAIALLRAGDAGLDDDEDLATLLGARGSAATTRLRLDADADAATVRDAAVAAVAHWRRRAAHPLASPADADVARVAVRTAEGLAAEAGR